MSRFRNSFLSTALMLTMFADIDQHRSPNRSVGPRPHTYSTDEAHAVAKQIAQQRKAKR